jgi:hypothetical protein
MKILKILTTLSLFLGTSAYARIGYDGGRFIATGMEAAESGSTYEYAKAEATGIANSQCAPLKAERVSRPGLVACC